MRDDSKSAGLGHDLPFFGPVVHTAVISRSGLSKDKVPIHYSPKCIGNPYHHSLFKQP